MNTELRFLKKLDGSKILQSRKYVLCDGVNSAAWSEWTDIPIMEEVPQGNAETVFADSPGVNVAADNPFGDPPDTEADTELDARKPLNTFGRK